MPEVTKWQYRIVSENNSEMTTGLLFTIREIYSEGDKLLSFSDPIAPNGSSPAELKRSLEEMGDAFILPILKLSDFSK